MSLLDPDNVLAGPPYLRFVPASVREAPRYGRKRWEWLLDTHRERLALLLCPWWRSTVRAVSKDSVRRAERLQVRQAQARRRSKCEAFGADRP